MARLDPRAQHRSMTDARRGSTYSHDSPLGAFAYGLAHVVDGVRFALDQHAPSVRRAARQLGAGVKLLGPVGLPDGRVIPEIALGRFGAVVFRELPNDLPVRHLGLHWEAQVHKEWLIFENPLQRACRDAEALRRYLDCGERDFVVSVHAVFVSAETALERVPGCTVLPPEQIGPFLSTLTAQRTLTPDRLGSVAETISRLRPA